MSRVRKNESIFEKNTVYTYLPEQRLERWYGKKFILYDVCTTLNPIDVFYEMEEYPNNDRLVTMYSWDIDCLQIDYIETLKYRLKKLQYET